MSFPKVSVSLLTYNHAPFIAQAIESVLDQVTSFPVELVIGEDDSADGTRKIVARYAEAHPLRIRAHFHSRDANLSYEGQPTGRLNFVRNVRAARGEYIALLDGDDYWTDPEKLQRQADFLDAHPECSTCFHRVENVDEGGRALGTLTPAGPIAPRQTFADLLHRKFVAPTASVMFRRGLFPDFPEWYFRCPVGDFPLHVLNGLHGDFGFLDRVMAAYRVHAGGRWSAESDHVETEEARRRSGERKLRQLDGVAHLYEILAGGEELAAHRRILRDSAAAYRFQAAELLRGLEDWPAVRARLGELVRTWPLPAGIPWRRVGWLFLEACAPNRLRRRRSP